MAAKNYDELVDSGTQIDTIDVKISHQIIKLFSEGLYSSPHKAIEELVSNAFDANAHNVHVIMSTDLTIDGAKIVVIDDGDGMDVDELKQHWIIGRSSRRSHSISNTRQPIGKFGIGKLSTYVLAKRLTHICKVNDIYHIATMDYSQLEMDKKVTGKKKKVIPEEGIFNNEKISLPVRRLTKSEARQILKPWIENEKPGYQALKLFGDDARDSWTVSIMSDLRDMGKSIQRGRLNWVLRTAMPLRDDFKLFVNGSVIEPSKIDIPLIQKWIIGKDITGDTLSKPCPKGFQQTEDVTVNQESLHRYGLSHEKLGRVTGYVELYESDLSIGKSEEIERSNGFFVYVRGRMIMLMIRDLASKETC
jgi:hypothetical protein